ncbi:MAG TPA: hypothetical protein VNI02_08405 [Blastocatellia bacterium]|jgi:hypothetical protein|nr:hypothetical protein [Blastocatellia bacterium]
MTGITQKIVGPHNCALAFTIPLTEEDFLHDLNRGAEKDFIKRYAQENGAIRKELLWKYYKPQADLALEIADEVKHLGVKTAFNLKLSELKAFIAGSDIVALVAHWRPPTFTADDLVDPASLMGKIKESKNEAAELLRARASPEFNGLLIAPRPDEGALAASLLCELNRVLAEERLHPECRRSPPLYRHEYLLQLNREALEEAFPGEFRGGSRVEFFDRLCSMNDVAEQISPEYRGLLDLTICNSILLGEAIKRKRRHCTVVANQNPATFDFRLIFYKHVIKELERQNNRYLDVVVNLRKRLTKY